MNKFHLSKPKIVLKKNPLIVYGESMVLREMN